MRRRITAAVLTGLLVGGSTTVLGVPAAEAHIRPCVSKAEFRAVQKGYRMARVHRIFDTRGTQEWFFSGPPAEQGRHYRACTHTFGFHGDVWVDYRKRDGVWRLTSKDAFW